MAGATVIAPINDDTGAPNVDPLSPQDAAELISLLDQLPVDELELATERFTLSLRRTGTGWVSRTTVGSSTPDDAPVAAAAEEVPDGLVGVRSAAARHVLPLAAARAAAVRRGRRPVGADTVIGMVETMKLITPVACGRGGHRGRVLRAGNGDVRRGRTRSWRW